MEDRIAKFYPDSKYPAEGGGIIPEIVAMVAAQETKPGIKDDESGFEMKQSTMSDAAMEPEKVFETVRPNLVLPEASTNAVLPDDVMTEYTLGQLSEMQVKMSKKFEDQFNGKYMPRIYPYILNYNCGGPEYPDLFADWSLETVCPDKRWRRKSDEAFLLPGPHAQMLATRPESQISSDWMLVPTARTLHWRYTVLRNSFVACKRKIHPAETVSQDLSNLIDAAASIFRRLQKNTVMIDGHSRPLRNDVSLLYRADDITADEQAVLRGTLNATKNVAGCQALRKRIGHVLFGFRVVHGECLFWTISPKPGSSYIKRGPGHRRNTRNK